MIETALQWIGGRAILNSVNLEDGDAPGTRLDRFLSLAREYGAAVVCTCIDEEGQARTPEWKLKAAKSIHDIAVDRYGLEPGDLFFDPLALTLGTGMEESRGDGVATLEGIKLIKEHLPGVHTTLGPLQHLLRPQPGRPPRPQLGVPARGRPGRPRLGHRPRRPHHAARSDPRRAEAGLPRRHLRPAHRRLRPAPGAPVDVRGRQRRRRSRRRTAPTGRSSSASPPASSRATATASPPTSTWPSTAGHSPLGDHQRHPPRGDEGRRRPVRQGRDAAAVRAAVGRDDEGGRRLPRADDGQGRRRVHQGPHRARHGEGRRPRHRQEPRRHHPHQQRLRGAQPRHQGERRPRWSTRPSR